MRFKETNFHFVGIGGIGMCGLAELLHNMGAIVTGSDLSDNANTQHLKSIGVTVFKGHSENNVGRADVVVYSSAVDKENPEIQAARFRRIPLIARAEALAEIMRLKRGLAVAGTHGKTTTTSMTASIFLEAQVQPTIFIGGKFDLIQSTALLGEGEWFIAEADESDGSFHKLSPEISIITNIDSDHLDFYKTFEQIQKSFYNFAAKTPFYGICIVCGDDPRVRDLFKNFSKRILFYGFDNKNDIVLVGEKGRYALFKKNNSSNPGVSDVSYGDFELKVPGRHNALNAMAAIIAGVHAGFAFETCRRGLLKFQGVDRRFHFKGEGSGVKVYDDYGHHPTEVKAALQGFREKFPGSRIIVFFQPHRYSRTESCWNEFTECFSQAELLFLGDIYPAGEKPIPQIHSERLSTEVKNTNCIYAPMSTSLPKEILEKLRRNDVFVTLGAGDGWKLGLDVLGLLQKS